MCDTWEQQSNACSGVGGAAKTGAGGWHRSGARAGQLHGSNVHAGSLPFRASPEVDKTFAPSLVPEPSASFRHILHSELPACPSSKPMTCPSLCENSFALQLLGASNVPGVMQRPDM